MHDYCHAWLILTRIQTFQTVYRLKNPGYRFPRAIHVIFIQKIEISQSTYGQDQKGHILLPVV